MSNSTAVLHTGRMLEPLVPSYVSKLTITSLETLSSDGCTGSWKVTTAPGPSFIIRNTYMSPTSTTTRMEYAASTMGLKQYGPPAYLYRKMHVLKDREVLVEVREYIAGAPLSEFLASGLHCVLSDIEREIPQMLSAHGSVTCEANGSQSALQGGGLNTRDFLRVIRGSHLCRGKKCRLGKRRTPRRSLEATLCHCALTPDHVIINDGKVVAIVGWSNAKFMPSGLQMVGYLDGLDNEEYGDASSWVSSIVAKIALLTLPDHTEVLRLACKTLLCEKFGTLPDGKGSNLSLYE